MEVAAIAAMYGALLAAQSNGDVPYFNEGIVGISILGILALLWKIQRSVIRPLTSRADGLDRALKLERLERRIVEWRMTEVARLVRGSGIEISDSIMYGEPEWARRMREELTK